jgi:hypothetical protein
VQVSRGWWLCLQSYLLCFTHLGFRGVVFFLWVTACYPLNFLQLSFFGFFWVFFAAKSHVHNTDFYF